MKEIRDYFHLQARSIDPEIVEKKSPVQLPEISQVDLDCAYHLYIGPSSNPGKLNDGVEDNFACRMNIYSNAGVNDNERYDRAYTKAICIRNALVKAENIGQNEYINDVAPVSIVPATSDENEKVFIFSINLNVSVTTCL